jgi:hypothetical protein
MKAKTGIALLLSCSIILSSLAIAGSVNFASERFLC